jgi:hypothetical protein
MITVAKTVLWVIFILSFFGIFIALFNDEFWGINPLEWLGIAVGLMFVEGILSVAKARRVE